MRTTIYVLLFAAVLQFGLPHAVPNSWVINQRVEYDTIKNNMATDLGVAMDTAARDIRQHPDQDYVVLIGDSVTYSAPGPADHSIGSYLEQYGQAHGHPFKVYNFAEPGMTGGDVYTVVLMLQEHGVPLKRVVIDQIYPDFTYHPASEPMFQWLGDELQRLDPEGWHIAHGEAATPTKPLVRARQAVLNNVSLWRYRDFLRTQLYAALHVDNSAEAKDTRLWTEKKLWLNALMQQPMYQRVVDPHPLDLTTANPTIQLTDRMFAALKDAQVLVWFAPFNQELMAAGVAQPGYQQNLKQIDAWYRSHTQIDYVQLRTAIDPALFTDHLHMAPAGYAQVANILGERLLTGTNPIPHTANP
ncbi:MAG: hypothetical protein JWN15_2971 [Firmicutes bacterium]|nr:hypothetical protein [Bacillota bacterium]